MISKNAWEGLFTSLSTEVNMLTQRVVELEEKIVKFQHLDDMIKALDKFREEEITKIKNGQLTVRRGK